ncbi:MAG: FAD-binding oxidoreductase [Saprospiraceae bacterium]|nr:FAD-binding oxidoreductase [Saprospiraceae bacterium]
MDQLFPFNISYWERIGLQTQYDLCIVGSGIVGLNAGISYLENKPNSRVCILERGWRPDGASTKNAGFACFGSAGELLDDLQNQSAEEVFALFKKRYDGIGALRKRLPNEDIGWNSAGGYEVFTDENKMDCPSDQQLQQINAEIQKWTGLKNYFSMAHDEISNHGFTNVAGMIKTEHESLLDPMKMILSLMKKFYALGGQIYFNTSVLQWQEETEQLTISCNHGFTFSAQKLLLATNGFAKQLMPELQLTAARNHVLVLKTQNPLLLTGAYHHHKGYVYFRPVKGGLLIGGGRHLDLENEYTDQIGYNPKIQHSLIEFAEQHLLENNRYEICDSWVGIMGLGPVKKPIIQMQSQRVGVSVRMGGMGIAIGTLVGNEAAEMLLKQ